jgi:hypothetical protein
MAHAWHHAESSARRFGGDPARYLPIHEFLDASKIAFAGVTHRALRHHAFGCYEAEERFGQTIDRGDGRRVPVRLIAERHIVEDLGRVPSVQDWLAGLPLQPWMLGGAIDRCDHREDGDASVERWRADVAAGITVLGYGDWLRARSSETPVRPFLDVSTGHLSPGTRALLDDEDMLAAAPSSTLRGTHGWMIHVPEVAQPVRWPRDLESVLAHARHLACDYVLFDADGPRHDALAWFEDDDEPARLRAAQ